MKFSECLRMSKERARQVEPVVRAILELMNNSISILEVRIPSAESGRCADTRRRSATISWLM